MTFWDILHEMSDLVFRENKKKINMSCAESFTQSAKYKPYDLRFGTIITSDIFS